MSTFTQWYKKRHDYSPFPWQKRLAKLIKNGEPPNEIFMPTSAGKTAIIDVWLWAHAQGFKVPTRLFYIIDRRILVDSVSEYAKSLIINDEIDINIIQLRGGQTEDRAWLMNPQTPTIVVCTVDQIGSRLLFRGYGVSNNVTPIHAGLVGNDAFLVLDEAHISTPLLTTLMAIDKFRVNETQPWWLLPMTATPANIENALCISDDDLVHPVLKQRLYADKLAMLKKAAPDSFVNTMVDSAKELRNLHNAGVIGIICNTAKDARRIFYKLGDTNKTLLTGRIRQKEKDELLETLLPSIASGSRSEEREPIYVVATQTIEVGADLDFDAIVTQNAPIDALRQRFGRQDRLGELGKSFAMIVHKDLGKGDVCYVYGKKLLKSTWTWLGKVASGSKKNKCVNFGVMAMGESVKRLAPPEREPIQTPELTQYILRKLRQTQPVNPIDITPFLHGNVVANSTVSVVWRADLIKYPEDKWPSIVNAVPPVIAEAMPCPLYEIQRWLKKRVAVVGERVVTAHDIEPGDIIVIPSEYGGYDQWGWNADVIGPVTDIGNQYASIIRLIDVDDDCDINKLLNEQNITHITRPVTETYPAGILVRNANKRVKDKAVNLTEHLKNCGEVAALLSSHDPNIIKAAKNHDIGKRDPRFQCLLGAENKPLAKSGQRSLIARRQAIKFCGLPKGWRHELNSVALLPPKTPELIRYLVATHHGYARTILPFAAHEDLWEQLDGKNWGNMTKMLNEEYGMWGLAYKEALVRLSDWVQSKKEQDDA